MSTSAITPQQNEPLNPLVGKIRAKYPGAYDDMDDAQLTKAVLAKHPQYEDLARPSSPIPGSPATQPMEKIPQSIAGRLANGPEDTPASGSKVPLSIQQAPDQLGEAIGGAAALGAAPAITSIASRIPYVGPLLGKAAKAVPTIAAMEGIGYLRRNLPLGKYIPAGAEWLPVMIGGGEAKDSATEKIPPADVSENPTAPIPASRDEPFSSPPYGPYEGGRVIAPTGRDDILDDYAVKQDWEKDMGNHYRAAHPSSARYIERTKGTMSEGIPPIAAASKPAGIAPKDDLTEDWRKNLDYLKSQKAKKVSD